MKKSIFYDKKLFIKHNNAIYYEKNYLLNNTIFKKYIFIKFLNRLKYKL